MIGAGDWARFPPGAAREGKTWLRLGGRGPEQHSLGLSCGTSFLGAPQTQAQVSEGPQGDPEPGDFWGRESSLFQMGPPSRREDLGVCPHASADTGVTECLIGSLCITPVRVPGHASLSVLPVQHGEPPCFHFCLTDHFKPQTRSCTSII